MNMKEHLISSMADLDDVAVLADVREMMNRDTRYESILFCLDTGVTKVGERFEAGEYFIADMIVSSMIYRDALNVLMPIVPKSNLPVGRVVIGVVAGDIHDLGKDIVVSLLRAEHFEVIDLGIDVKPERFASAVQTYKPDVLLLSGALSFAQRSMRSTMDELRRRGLRDKVPILIGGMCANEYQKELVGADSWAYALQDTVEFCKRIVGEKYGGKC